MGPARPTVAFWEGEWDSLFQGNLGFDVSCNHLTNHLKLLKRLGAEVGAQCMGGEISFHLARYCYSD